LARELALECKLALAVAQEVPLELCVEMASELKVVQGGDDARGCGQLLAGNILLSLDCNLGDQAADVPTSILAPVPAAALLPSN